MDSLLQRFFLLWRTRSLGVGIERLMVILPVAIFFDGKVSEEELACAQEILRERLSLENLADDVMERVKMRLQEYEENPNEYLLDRQKSMEIIAQDIQLYAVMKEIFEAEGARGENERALEEVIKKKFDEMWKLDDPKARCLEEREEGYIRGWQLEENPSRNH